MSPTATVSRGGTSVDIEVIQDGNSLAVARDIGKPNLNIYEIGKEDPNFADHLSSLDVFTLSGKLKGSSAYSDAQTLAEDLVKPRPSTGSPLNIDISFLPNRTNYDVAVSSAQALSLTYPAGIKNYVEVDLQAVVVDEVIGGSQSADANLSPDSGSGIKIVKGSDEITLSKGLEVERIVGRPGTKIQETPSDLPRAIDKNDPAADIFSIRAGLTSSAEADSDTLEETIVRPTAGTTNLELHFLGNEYGLDAYRVVPDGSQAIRTAFNTGETGIVTLPTLNFRVVSA